MPAGRRALVAAVRWQITYKVEDRLKERGTLLYRLFDPIQTLLEHGVEILALWYGGRLGVHSAFRRHNQIGKGLIWKAVTTANGWGCDRFLATVQLQNVRFFKRLHWTSIEELEIRGIRHHLMQADLSYYVPAKQQRPSLQLTA